MMGVTICLVIVGLINFAPVLGLFSVSKLNQAYELALVSPDLILLMRHRVLLFGILGAFILYSAFVPKFQTAAMVMALVSMSGFVVLILMGGEYNASLMKIMWIDVLVLIVLALAAALKWGASFSFLAS